MNPKEQQAHVTKQNLGVQWIIQFIDAMCDAETDAALNAAGDAIRVAHQCGRAESLANIRDHINGVVDENDSIA